MKIIIILTTIFYSTILFSQKINVLPKDENGKVHFSKIITSNNLEEYQTYNKSKLFFVNTFTSAKDVIQMEDKNTSTIIGKANSTLRIRSGKYDINVIMNFTIKIQSKDGKCKIDIYNITYNNESKAEDFFNSSNESLYIKSNNKVKKIMEDYRDETLDKIAFIQSKLKDEFYKKDINW